MKLQQRIMSKTWTGTFFPEIKIITRIFRRVTLFRYQILGFSFQIMYQTSMFCTKKFVKNLLRNDPNNFFFG